MSGDASKLTITSPLGPEVRDNFSIESFDHSFQVTVYPSRIHERSVSLMFLGVTLRVSVNNVYISNQFQTTFAQGERVGGGESKIRSRGDCE
jgi:hypothetical protein